VKALGVLGWSVLLLGMVVLLVAPLYIFIRGEDLRNEAVISAERWNLSKAEAAEAERARLRLWPGVFTGLALTTIGIAVLQIRKYRLEREE